MIMHDFRTSKHIDVQQRVLEYHGMKQRNLNDRDFYKGTPLNEEQVMMDNFDLDLNFLQGFVDEQLAQGKRPYDKSMSMNNANASFAPSAGLNFKAYEQEVPKYPTINQTYGPSAPATATEKETLKNNPVFTLNQPNPTNAEAELKVNNVSRVWGAGGGPEPAKPAEPTSHYT